MLHRSECVDFFFRYSLFFAQASPTNLYLVSSDFCISLITTKKLFCSLSLSFDLVSSENAKVQNTIHHLKQNIDFSIPFTIYFVLFIF